MVSLQPALSPEEKTCPILLHNFLSRKRKCCGDREESDDYLFMTQPKFVKAEEEEEDIALNLDAPLPLEWQRCLDIKSGQIHYYNTRTHTRTSRDPRLSLEPPSLDLELNLACEPPRSHISVGGEGEEPMKQDICSKTCNSNDNSCGGMLPSLPWMSLEANPKEMVAAICMRCHMLVMMSKAALSCPNCKFVHPPHQSSSSLLNPGFKPQGLVLN